MAKVLVIISSSDKAKALTGILWAFNALKHGWVEDLKLVLFGPVEKLVAERDPDLVNILSLMEPFGGEPIACRRMAEAGGYLEDLEKTVKTEYVGPMIARLLEEGYTPLVF
ncbi:MAG: hypothetical protein F7B18_06240 [Desulfurococcales archaeon]|nr:hypothetical protein [Desulfurococcales archaeon]